MGQVVTLFIVVVLAPVLVGAHGDMRGYSCSRSSRSQLAYCFPHLPCSLVSISRRCEQHNVAPLPSAPPIVTHSPSVPRPSHGPLIEGRRRRNEGRSHLQPSLPSSLAVDGVLSFILAFGGGLGIGAYGTTLLTRGLMPRKAHAHSHVAFRSSSPRCGLRRLEPPPAKGSRPRTK